MKILKQALYCLAVLFSVTAFFWASEEQYQDEINTGEFYEQH